MNDLALLTARLATVLRDRCAPARVLSLKPLAGGASGLTYLATLDGVEERDAVIKVAPRGVAPTGHRDVLRQARIIRFLADRPGIRVPEVLFEDAGAPPDVPPLYAMTHVEGQSFEPNKDPLPDRDMPPAPAELRARAFSAVGMLSALHRVSLDAPPLRGEPSLTPADELLRWERLAIKVVEEIGPEAARVADRLGHRVPAPNPSVLLHGDFRLGNLLCRSGQVMAIIDWEIWAIGDPRSDLAWFLLTASPDVHPLAVRHAPGMPDPGELLAAYEAKHGAMRNLEWFRALALFKMAASTALIVRNNRRAGDPHGRAAHFAPRIPIMLERALAALT